MLNIGNMRHCITIQRKNTTKNGPHAVGAWTDFASAWAELVSFAASEFATGFGEAERGTVVFRIRYRADITTADKIAYEGRTYDIKDILETGWRNGLEIRAVAVS